MIKKSENTMPHAPTPTYLYFAYGPGLVSSRWERRISSIKEVGPGYLREYRIVFNVPSSYKREVSFANLKRTGVAANRVMGMLWSISSDDLGQLDLIEGPDYSRVSVQIALVEGGVSEAWTHVELSGKASPATEVLLVLRAEG